MRLIYFNLLNMEKFETEYKGKLGKKDKGINIPCLAFKNKKDLIKISKENKFIIDESLKLDDYRFKLLLKFSKKKEIAFNYSNIDSRKYLETILPCFPQPMLFLGWANYTNQYKKICDMVSVDINSKVKPDKTADITKKDFKKKVKEVHNKYKSIINNGVIGWGVNQPKQIRDSLKNCKDLLTNGGFMLCGWNVMAFEGHKEDSTITISMMKKYLKEGGFKQIKLIYNSNDEWKQAYIICQK